MAQKSSLKVGEHQYICIAGYVADRLSYLMWVAEPVGGGRLPHARASVARPLVLWFRAALGRPRSAGAQGAARGPTSCSGPACLCALRLAQDAELERLHGAVRGRGRGALPEPDTSAAEWLRARGATPRMLAVADACYANDFGCSLDQLGLCEMITENRRWDSGGRR